MLEESKAEPVLPEDRKRTFESQALWKRVVIVFAGPIMNLIFPVVLYFSVFVGERNFLPPTIGVVLPGHAADGKLLPGDRILAVDGEEIGTYTEFSRAVQKSPGRGSTSRCPATPATSMSCHARRVIEPREFDMVERVGKPS
jgi:regulator of sigma E protease